MKKRIPAPTASASATGSAAPAPASPATPTQQQQQQLALPPSSQATQDEKSTPASAIELMSVAPPQANGSSPAVAAPNSKKPPPSAVGASALAKKLKAAGAGKANPGFASDAKEEASAPATGVAPIGGPSAAAGDVEANAATAAAAVTDPAAAAAAAAAAGMDSLRVAGNNNRDFLKLEEAGGGGPRAASNQNRRLSTVSQMSHFSGGDFSNSVNGGLPDSGDQDDAGQQRRKRFNSNDNYIQEQVPVLPVPAAACVLVCNTLIPGVGTILSGLLYLCLGPKDHRKGQGFFKPVCVNFWVGISQLVTVTFLLVGWFWSVSWGIYALQKALDQRDEFRRKRKQEITEKALNVFMGVGGGGGGGDQDGGVAASGSHHTGGLMNLLKPH